MKRVFVVLTVALGLGACSSGSTGMTPAEEVSKLITLYEQDRPKFVVQKQKLEQAGDCDRATKLREEIDRRADAAAMEPGDSSTITKVQMELQQAEKTCND